jgi:hypothetical protein
MKPSPAWSVILSLALVCVVAGQTPTGTTVTPEVKVAANEAYQKQDWVTAAAQYAAIVKAEDKNVGARYRYGMALMNLGRNPEAKRELESAFQASPNAIFALALARANARMKDTATVFAVLERSLTMGGIAPDTLKAEKDFAYLTGDAKFQELVRRSDLAVNPCKGGPEFRQFDFWIGEWEARNPQGLVGGTSSIQLILGSCIIFENWTGTSGTNGKSFNIFDVNDKKWHQTWVDDKGTFTHYVGGLVDGKMVLVADTVVNGRKTLAKMTFSKLSDESVRQLGENSTDDGKTWSTSFDFTYVRKK